MIQDDFRELHEIARSSFRLSPPCRERSIVLVAKVAKAGNGNYFIFVFAGGPATRFFGGAGEAFADGSDTANPQA